MATYFVATDGDNGAGGSQIAPWRTLVYAATHISAGDTLYVRGGTYVEAPDFLVDGTAIAPIVISGYSGEPVIIDGEYTLPTTSHLHFLVEVWGDYTTFRDFTIKRSNGALFVLGGVYASAINLIGQGSKESGMIAGDATDHCLFDGCSMTDNGNGYGLDGQESWGSAIATVGANTTIQNCVAFENRGEGLNAYSASSNVLMQDNIVYDNKSYNIYFDSSNGGVCRRNIVYQTKSYNMYGITVGAETGQPTGVIEIYNNLVMGCKANFHIDSNVTALTGVKVVHNTFVNFTGDADQGYNMGVYYRADPSSYSNSVFKNNIVLEETEGRVPIYVESSHAGLVFSNNCWWTDNAITAARGTGDVNADPKLAKAGPTGAGTLTKEYFKLLSDSPCINAGADVGIDTDFDGNARH